MRYWNVIGFQNDAQFLRKIKINDQEGKVFEEFLGDGIEVFKIEKYINYRVNHSFPSAKGKILVLMARNNEVDSKNIIFKNLGFTGIDFCKSF